MNIFRRDVTFDNIKSHQKIGLRPLFQEKTFLEKPQWGVSQIDPLAFLALTDDFWEQSKNTYYTFPSITRYTARLSKLL